MSDERAAGAEGAGPDAVVGPAYGWSAVLEALMRMQGRQLAAHPGAEVIDLPGVIGTVGPRSWVYVHEPVDPDLLASRVAAVHPAALVLLAEAVPSSVDGALAQCGWSSRRPLDLMVAVDVHEPTDHREAPVEAVGPDNVRAAQQVCDLAFGAPGDLSSWVGGVGCGGLLARDPDGRPIAVAGWQRAGRAARIENVATAADRRGEGWGAALTARAVAAAKNAGAAFTFLEATEAGAGVYRRIGFGHIARWRVQHRVIAGRSPAS